MTRETKYAVRVLHSALIKEYGDNFELAMSSNTFFFTSSLPKGQRRKKGKQEDIDVNFLANHNNAF